MIQHTNWLSYQKVQQISIQHYPNMNFFPCVKAEQKKYKNEMHHSTFWFLLSFWSVSFAVKNLDHEIYTDLCFNSNV